MGLVILVSAFATTLHVTAVYPKRELTEQIKLAFDANGLTFPFPSRDVYLQQESSAA